MRIQPDMALFCGQRKVVVCVGRRNEVASPVMVITLVSPYCGKE